MNEDKLFSALIRCATALDNILGPGAQLEGECDEAEHDDDSPCIFCEGRKALAVVDRMGLIKRKGTK